MVMVLVLVVMVTWYLPKNFFSKNFLFQESIAHFILVTMSGDMGGLALKALSVELFEKLV